MLDLSSAGESPRREEARGFCFLGFCSDEGVRRNLGRTGAARAPESLRKEMSNLPCYFDSRTRLVDAGDVLCVDNHLESALDDLSSSLVTILSTGLFPIGLGGGHEIALGHYNAIRTAMGNDYRIGIINFDAHFDLRPYAHGGGSGSMFLQIADECRRSRTEFSYFCVGIQQSANTASLFRKADELGARYVLARDIDPIDLSAVSRMLDDYIRKHDGIYLTICADVFSAAYAPGVSAPQPFGLLPETVLKLMKHVLRSGKVVSADIAEVSPRFDNDNRTAKLAAITIFAMINTILGLSETYP